MRVEKRYYVYIMASRSKTLYTGITDDLFRRVMEHKSGEIEGFTKRYRIERLVYYETFKYVGKAIAREKQIKSWKRAKRLALIESMNPTWQDLAEDWGKTFELQIPRGLTPPRDDNPENLFYGAPEGVPLQRKPASIGAAEGAPLQRQKKTGAA